MLAVFALLALLAPAAQAQSGGSGQNCFGEIEAEGVEQLPGGPLRFGITPRVEAGQIGPVSQPAVRDDPPRTLDALRRLRPTGRPLVMRLNRFFWSEEERGIQEFLTLAERYTSRGFLVELQLRYHPRPDQEGNIAAWTEFVREVVRRFGPNRRVVAVQVTNEVNFAFSQDSSDGAYRGARDALVQGVIAAKDEAEKGGHEQLEIGFNWFYRTDPNNESSFWQHLRDRGGPEFVAALDWVGLDAYPGTFFPPAEPTGDDFRDGIVNGLSTLRCLMGVPGIPQAVPVHVEENGYPTSPPSRSYEQQAEAAEAMIRAVHDFRGTYNVTDYRWFNLRDANSSDPNFQQQYGLLRDDYTPKPAFPLYSRLIEELSVLNPEPDVRLDFVGSPRSGRCGRAAEVGFQAGGADVHEVEHVELLRGSRVVATDSTAPFNVGARFRRRPSTTYRVAIFFFDERVRRSAFPAFVCSKPGQVPPRSGGGNDGGEKKARCRRTAVAVSTTTRRTRGRGICARNKRGTSR